MPVAMFEFVLCNTTDAPIDYSVIGVLGHGVEQPTIADTAEGKSQRCGDRDRGSRADAPDYAELVLATDAPTASRQSYLYRGLWFDALEIYWRDLQHPARSANAPMRRQRP